MHGELSLSASVLIAFALVLSRMAGIFVFVPMPVQEAGPSPARIAMAIASTLILFPRWPRVEASEVNLGLMSLWMLSELALGTAIGLMVSCLSEFLTFSAQIFGLQAGYGYASVVDPTTQADSNVLSVVAQLTAGLLFFTTGLHRTVISAFAASLKSYPPGQFTLHRNLAKIVVEVGSSVFSVGLRLALPVIVMLVMTDLAFGVIGRINAQLQMGANAFPAKMLLTLVMLATTLAIAPSIYQAFSADVSRSIRTLLAY
jgi:flagellar biosynthesis protein FliR